MFVNATSLDYHLEDHLRKNKIHGSQKKAMKIYAEFHDDFVLGEANMHLPFPLNILTLYAINWGVSIPFAIVLPILMLFFGVFAQESYYNWRYSHTGISID